MRKLLTEELRYRHLVTDSCVFIKGEGDNKIIVTLYVDDFIMAAKSMSTIQSLIAQVKARLAVTDRPLTVCLGINFTDNRADDNSVSIDLDAFADKMTAKFEEHIPGGRAVNTPIRHDIHYD